MLIKISVAILTPNELNHCLIKKKKIIVSWEILKNPENRTFSCNFPQ